MRNAAQIAVFMAILTLGSKFLGFVREMIMANYFGTSYITDAYVMANAIPGIILGGLYGSVSAAYMPVYSRILENEGIQESNKFTSEIINVLSVFSIIAALFGIVFSDQIVSIFASGFTGETAILTSRFVKVTFCYILFTSVSGILEAFLQYKNVFLIQLFLGYIQNIILIIVIVISAFTNFHYLIIGWLVAYITRALYLLLASKKHGYIYTPSINLDQRVRQIALISVPVFISSGIYQINSFVDKTLASGLEQGSVSALNYALLLVGLITGLTTSILTTILYPKLNKANSLNDYGRLSEMINSGISYIAIIAIPCALGAMVYSRPIVQVIYERGAFDLSATAMTASVFLFFSIGIPFLSVNEVMIRVYYTLQDMKSPMVFAGISVIVNIILNLVLIKHMGQNGLALATSISYITNSILLYFGITIKYKNIKIIKFSTKFLAVIMSAVLSIGLSYIIYKYFIVKLLNIEAIQLGISVAIAAISYLLLMKLFRIKEIDVLEKIIRKG